MQAFIIIFSVICLLVYGGLFLIKSAAEAQFKELPYGTQVQKLRQLRATYNALSGKERNSSVGKSASKSIRFMQSVVNAKP